MCKMHCAEMTIDDLTVDYGGDYEAYIDDGTLVTMFNAYTPDVFWRVTFVLDTDGTWDYSLDDPDTGEETGESLPYAAASWMAARAAEIRARIEADFK